ncbi:hypothetical protein SAMN02746089_01910 [Caldanaerobius fijiensis DSM 17918]|uniref:Uncharacterized protein n=1 Tax=Caldanaerobius fijiensis DSM 17918 TaxID=1121256 RepID=A0A1M5BM20_9THEO|nr:hypothetical protein [Caldanaerobius fijiensis]SHF43440.1 hypothetical protein SAMN02746089_01910 [Caldanaerobius fijiensis DSM 17918]
MSIDWDKEEYYEGGFDDDYDEDDFDEDDKISFNKDMPQNLIRPYSETTNKLIVLMTNVDGYDADRIAHILKRDPVDVLRHILEMKADGTFDRYHEEMMAYDGLYRYQMLKKLEKLKKVQKQQGG